MTQEEINKRNEAIALFDGWVAMSREEARIVLNGDPLVESETFYQSDTGRIRRIANFTYDRDWNALMPVVEKIRVDRNVGVGFCKEHDVDGANCVYFHGPTKCNYYVWSGTLEVTKKALYMNVIACQSYTQAYWLAVSDYCLSLIE